MSLSSVTSDYVMFSPVLNYISGNSSAHATPISLLSMISEPKVLTAEDRGMAALSMVFVKMPDHFWAMLCTIGVILIVHYISNVQTDQKSEDMSFYQALPIAVLWSALGIGLIFFNKFIFLPEGSGFNFPFIIFLMWWHALAGTISTNILRFARPDMMPAASEHKLDVKSYLVNILPIALLQASALAFGNTAYLYISVAYIQMVKNTTSAFVFVFSIMFGLERGTFSNTFAVVMVCIGLLLTTAGEMDFSVIGFMFQIAGTVCDSLRLSLTKIVLSSSHAVKLDPMSALYYSSPTVLMMLTLPVFLVDSTRMTLHKVWDMKFVLFANALLAFGLNMTSMFFMKRCGATTYALTGVVKDVALILLCCALFGHPMTTLQLCGFLISLAGFQLYNNLKADQAYLVKIWHSFRGVECMDEGSPLVGSPDECIKLDKCGKGLKATEEQSAVCHVTQVRKTSKIDV
jgi:hypothetical protein